MQIFYRNPPSLFISINGLAMISLEGEFEVGKGLVKCPDQLFHVDTHTHFISDTIR